MGESDARDFELQFDGARSPKSAKGMLLTSEKLTDENSFDAPTKVAPQHVPVSVSSAGIKQEVPAQSLMVLRIGV